MTLTITSADKRNNFHLRWLNIWKVSCHFSVYRWRPLKFCKFLRHGHLRHKQKLIRRYKHWTVNPYVTSETAAWGMWSIKKNSFCGTSVGDLMSIFKDERVLVRGWQCTKACACLWPPDESQGRHLERLCKTEDPWLWCCAVSSTAAQGTALCVVEVLKIIFISMIKYLLHESAIRASLNQWTQRSLLICLWKPSGITDGSRGGGWMQLSVTEAQFPSQEPACTNVCCTPRPTLRERGFYFSFCTVWAKNQDLTWLWQWDFKYTLLGCDTGTFFWWQDITQL